MDTFIFAAVLREPIRSCSHRCGHQQWNRKQSQPTKINGKKRKKRKKLQLKTTQRRVNIGTTAMWKETVGINTIIFTHAKYKAMILSTPKACIALMAVQSVQSHWFQHSVIFVIDVLGNWESPEKSTNQKGRELISAQKISHEHNKDLSWAPMVTLT